MATQIPTVEELVAGTEDEVFTSTLLSDEDFEKDLNGELEDEDNGADRSLEEMDEHDNGPGDAEEGDDEPAAGDAPPESGDSTSTTCRMSMRCVPLSSWMIRSRPRGNAGTLMKSGCLTKYSRPSVSGTVNPRNGT